MSILKNKKYIFIICVYTFVLLFFCAGSSPFIDYMDVDSSVFFAFGRGMRAGKIAYLDMFDHKGLYIFAINYIGALISSSTSWGIWIVETAFWIANSILFFNIFLLASKHEIESFWATLVFLGFALNIFTYMRGNFTEVYCLSFQVFSIYLLTKYFFADERGVHPPVYMLLHGICVGIVFGLRANMVLMWVPIAFVLLLMLIREGEWKAFWLNIIYGAAGVMIGVLPMLLYGIITGSMSEMIYQMLIINLRYSSSNLTLIRKIINVLFSIYIIPIFCGLISVFIVFKTRISIWGKVLFALMFFVSVVSTCISGRLYGHYFEYCMPFLLPLAFFIVKHLRTDKWKKPVSLLIALVVFAGSVTANGSLVLNVLTPYMNLPKAMSHRYIDFANHCSEIFKEKYDSSAKVLALGNNAIIYNKFDVIPHQKFIHRPALDYGEFPYAVDAHIKSILSGENDIIVLAYNDYSERKIYREVENDSVLEFIEKNYRLLYSDDILGMQMWEKSQPVQSKTNQ